MKALRRLSTLGTLLLLLVLMAGPLCAAPLPPVLVVNHETKQCAEMFAGDECMDCFPPEGWEVLGVSWENQCPVGYTTVERVEYSCQPFKNAFCCSEGHSGAPGDCEDLVVNHRTDECAFVDDIPNCELPRRWEQRPENVVPGQWVCPAGYTWLDSLQCGSHEDSGEASFPASLPCLGAIALGPLVAALWLRARQDG